MPLIPLIAKAIAPLQFSDDFNRADAASLGANWVHSANAWTIVSNQASPPAGHGYVRYVTATETDDQVSQATYLAGISEGVFVQMPGFAEGTAAGALTGAFYGFRQRAAGTGIGIYIRLSNSVSITELVTDTGITLASGDVIKLTYIGGVLTAYINDVQVLTHTPSSPIVGQRYVGFGTHAATNTLPAFDNWSGGDYSDAPPVVPTAQGNFFQFL